MSRHVSVEKYNEDENYIYYLFFEKIDTVELGRFKAKKNKIGTTKSLSDIFELIELSEDNKGLFTLAQGTVLKEFFKEGRYPDKAHFN